MADDALGDLQAVKAAVTSAVEAAPQVEARMQGESSLQFEALCRQALLQSSSSMGAALVRQGAEAQDSGEVPQTEATCGVRFLSCWHLTSSSPRADLGLFGITCQCRQSG